MVAREYELLEDSYAASVIINTSLDKNDHWLLLLSTTGGYGFSAKESTLTNGKDHITMKVLESAPFGSIMKSPARGIELYLNDQPIGAFQYQSGGGMGYKQYVWIADQATAHQKLIMMASFAAILELLQGGRVYYFDE